MTVAKLYRDGIPWRDQPHENYEEQGQEKEDGKKGSYEVVRRFPPPLPTRKKKARKRRK